MKKTIGVTLILIALFILSSVFFNNEIKDDLRSTDFIMTKAEANKYWDSLACK